MKDYSRTQIRLAWAVVGLAGSMIAEAAQVDFTKDVRPIFESSCLLCHGSERPKGGLTMVTLEDLLKGGDNGVVLVPGEPERSTIYTLTTLPPEHDDLMPPITKGGPLPKEQTDVIRQWIEEGAVWPEGVPLRQVEKVDFVTQIQPLLEFNCVGCHRPGEAEGGLRLDNRASAFQGGKTGPAIVPGRSSASLLYTSTILPEDHADLMPPTNKGGPMPKEESDLLWHWIDQGAFWPPDATLVSRRKEEQQGDDAALVEGLHAKIISGLEVTEPSEMKPYTETLPGSDETFDMIPIPGGEFIMGSDPGEAGRQPDEAPQHTVKIDPFWMGKTEVTWNEYELFMYPMEEKKIREFLGGDEDAVNALADAVSRPTTPYVEMSFGMGKDGFPAISMTHHAASTYCKWLTAKTGHYYRLPTEAEWEYACRAGTTTAYSFGDDPALLDEYAWHAENSDWKYQKVAQKKPNPWGLYDMHGNVAEWTLDQYDPEYYRRFVGLVADNPWNQPVTLYPRTVRGGSWDDDPEALRSAARRGSSAAWKMQDPQLPKSIWYHTDAQFLGLRVVRPLTPPSAEELGKYWTSGLQKD